MKITKYRQLSQVSFMPRLFPVNVYLVEEENELTLIDAGLPYSHKGILQAAAHMGKPITRILLTHAHDDHVGALDRLMEALPGVELAISERDARLMAGDRSLEAEEAQAPIRGGVPASLKARPTRLLQEGDRVGSLEAVGCPGHTPGHMAYLDTRSRALIAGDAFQVRGGIAVAGTLKPLFPFPAFGTWHRGTAVASAKKLLALNPSCLAVGHGRLVLDPAAVMQKAIEEAEADLSKGGERRG
ncbi:MBL fold metallo-hydrolase [Paenibacillus silviterrae]|uniref:MBL fold metallo-hydrolase n=1 Tax=Paenibacillus silviterrae TaxID=3242194 RepID=UPI002543B4F3|nr:MBL fold metallo-hydrolase [Paenibacillus chinjuensis]